MNAVPARFSRIAGTGSFLPPNRVSNAQLAERLAADGVETSDEWIVERTGIRFRHFAESHVTCSDLGVAAARQALAAADCDPQAIDLLIVATSTPDMVFPSAACIVQEKLGIHGCAAFDVQAVCSGFVYALSVADSMIKTGLASKALVIGSEVFSRILDFTDRTTCVLFGDGAGAVVMEAQQQPGTREDRGILTSHLRSDGRHRNKLFVDGGPSSTGTVGHLRMEGKEVFRFAVGAITDVIKDVFRDTGYTAEDLDWFVPHQANKRIIDGSAHKLGIAPEKVVTTVDRHGNTSAASIPLALDVAIKDGRIKRGDLVLLEAMGGGFTWGAVLVRW
jgi:3-oxoacyl-[acyl-carrier-protein] synthase-3